MVAADIPPERRAAILARLEAIARAERVLPLFVVESGSRAWGFPSPDSDFDVRFVYARPASSYVSLRPPRDVIERPIERDPAGDLDIGGWALEKALGLALKSNAVLLEWARSPIVYAEEPGARDAIADFATRALRPSALRWHYFRLARRQLDEGGGEVRLKRFLYALRPALALSWLRRREAEGLPPAAPPMAIDALMAQAAPPEPVASAAAALIAAKRAAREAGTGRPDAALLEFVRDELARVEAATPSRPSEAAAAPEDALIDAADGLLRRWAEAAQARAHG